MATRKAPKFAKRDDEKNKATRGNGGVSKETKALRTGAMSVFDNCQMLNDRPTLKALCEVRDKIGLESDLQNFFQTYYVSLNVAKEGNEENDAEADLEDQSDIDDQSDSEDQSDFEDHSDYEVQYDQDDTEEENDLENPDDQDETNEEDDCLRPKGNTAKTYKSHFKMLILDFTSNEFDITNKSQFPEFYVS